MPLPKLDPPLILDLSLTTGAKMTHPTGAKVFDVCVELDNKKIVGPCTISSSLPGDPTTEHNATWAMHRRNGFRKLKAGTYRYSMVAKMAGHEPSDPVTTPLVLDAAQAKTLNDIMPCYFPKWQWVTLWVGCGLITIASLVLGIGSIKSSIDKKERALLDSKLPKTEDPAITNETPKVTIGAPTNKVPQKTEEALRQKTALTMKEVDDTLKVQYDEIKNLRDELNLMRQKIAADKTNYAAQTPATNAVTQKSPAAPATATPEPSGTVITAKTNTNPNLGITIGDVSGDGIVVIGDKNKVDNRRTTVIHLGDEHPEDGRSTNAWSAEWKPTMFITNHVINTVRECRVEPNQVVTIVVQPGWVVIPDVSTFHSHVARIGDRTWSAPYSIETEVARPHCIDGMWNFRVRLKYGYGPAPFRYMITPMPLGHRVLIYGNPRDHYWR